MSKYRVDYEFLKSVGNNLRRIRLEKGISQEELAHKAGLTLPQVGRFERGEINSGLSILSYLANALQIEPVELLEKLE